MHLHIPFRRRPAPDQETPPPRHEADSSMFWLVTGGDGGAMAGAPFTDRETALTAFFRHVAKYGNSLRPRVVSDKQWRRIQRGVNICPGITWAEVSHKNSDPQPALCGRAWPHRSHPLTVEPVDAVPAGPR